MTPLAERVARKIEAHLSELARTTKPVIVVLTPPKDGDEWDIEVKVRY